MSHHGMSDRTGFLIIASKVFWLLELSLIVVFEFAASSAFTLGTPGFFLANVLSCVNTSDDSTVCYQFSRVLTVL